MLNLTVDQMELLIVAARRYRQETSSADTRDQLAAIELALDEAVTEAPQPSITVTPPQQTARGLGVRQVNMLRSLHRHHGRWYHGCGWYTTSIATTIQILESLISRDLVMQDGTMMGNPVYRLTESGKKTAAEV